MSTLARVTASRADSPATGSDQGGLTTLSGFRQEFYQCLTAGADELFELAEAVLCTDGPVKTLVDPALAPEHRRGHGALYDGANHGRIEIGRLRRSLAAQPLPRAADGRIVLAADVSPWLRPDAATSPDRSFCHTYGRSEKTKHQMIPGWPYSIVAALEIGRTSWTALLDASRLEPGADLAQVSADQLRQVVERLIEADQYTDGEPAILIVLDAGYDVPRLAFLLADLPVEILGRMRSDRVMRRLAPSREEFDRAHPYGGRYPKHGAEFVFGHPATWGDPHAQTVTDTTRYGSATAMAWDRLHPILTHRAAWQDSPATCPSSRAPLSGSRSTTYLPPRPQAAVAVVVGHRRHRSRRRPALAGVPAEIRPGAHLQVAPADLRLDQAPPAQPTRRRHLDLAHPGRPHPAPPGPRPGTRSPPPLGEASDGDQTDPGSGLAGGFGTCARRHR
ncbi:transposase [Nonomuraea sp. NPDC050547]|uniref:transposase n=1 Tax=Nonomuraea sp. NPDC050547 TaxID=3364368 RepID=UPI0037A98E67